MGIFIVPINIKELKNMLDKIALALVVIGGINWGSIGLFRFNVVEWLCGGNNTVERVIYTLVALAGIWCISLLFRERESYH